MTNTQIHIRQWIILAVLVTVLVVFAILIAIFTQEKPKAKKEAPATTIHLDNDSFNEEHFVTTYGAQMSALEKEVRTLSAQLKREEERKKREAKTKDSTAQFNDEFSDTNIGLESSTSSLSASNAYHTYPQAKRSEAQGPRLVIKKVSDAE